MRAGGCWLRGRLVVGQAPPARAQLGYPAGNWPPPSGASAQPDAIVLSAIRANPLTAPYAINATWRNGSIILTGRVGTGVVHDMAVRTVIDLGYRVRDELVIDTAEAHRVAMAQAAAAGPWAAPVAGSLAGSAPYFVYPPPLFGRVDDPFFGLEPPLLSFAPWATSGNPDSRVQQAGMRQGGDRPDGRAMGVRSSWPSGGIPKRSVRSTCRPACADQGKSPVDRGHVGPGVPERSCCQRTGQADHRE